MMKKNYLNFLDELRSRAQLGINYSKSPYDLENYNGLLQLAADGYSEITGLPSEEVKERFKKELGYITPKVGVNGILFNDEGKILLEHRSDDLLWGLPGGWVDVCEGPEDAIEREFMEETALVVDPVEIIKFITRLPGEFNQPHSTVHILYLCKYISGDIKKSHESFDLKYLDYKTVKEWHKDHGVWAEEAVKYCSELKSSTKFGL
jgi:8-oxo-dGTP pyrophosphatase MutT (NUDIX family)